jgi:hypothetical protein
MAHDQFIEWSAAWQPDPVWQAWSNKAVRSSDLALLLAEVEHRAWIDSLLAYLDGLKSFTPQLDCNLCHFGQWYLTKGKRLYGQQEDFIKIDALHHQIHELANQLIDNYNQTQTKPSAEEVQNIKALRDELIAHLRILLDLRQKED